MIVILCSNFGKISPLKCSSEDHRSGENMDYKQRLIVAANCVYDGDLSPADEAHVNTSEFGITAALKPHQVEGVPWLIRRYHLGINVILGETFRHMGVGFLGVSFMMNKFQFLLKGRLKCDAMEIMGLGKTLQAISLLSYLKVCRKSPGPFLVLCPLSVTDGWVSEIANFAPNLRLIRYVGEKEHRRKLRREMHEYVNKLPLSSYVPTLPFEVLLTTYDIALIDQDFLSQFSWHYAIIDEAQRLKNPSSVLYNVLRDRFVMPRKLLMTGTPIQNNLAELWALMHFCMPLIFGTLEQFLSNFKEAGDPSLMTHLTPLQKKVYVSILRNELPKLLALASGASSAQSLQNIVIQLRKACSHPYLFPGIEPEPYQEGEHLVQASGKLLILDQLLQKLHDSGHRVLLFAQMTHTLDILQDFLEMRKYTYERLDGSIRAEERFAAIRSFSQKSIMNTATADSHKCTPFIFLISTRAGGVGLNLVAADTVIFYEQDWNPQVDKQALQRAHRIGQSNHVLSINLATGRTIEEVIMRRAERKLQLSHNVIGDDNLDHGENNVGRAEAGDLKSIIFGLHVFDPMEMNIEKSDNELDMEKMSGLAGKVIAFHQESKSDVGERTFEINPMNLMDGKDLVMHEGSQPINFDPGLDEASYMSWVEKFKQTLPADDSNVLESGNRRQLPDEKNLKAEASRKKAEEKKLSKWEALGYHSLSVTIPDGTENQDLMSGSGSVHFVYGDCTNTAAVSPMEPTIIFRCILVTKEHSCNFNSCVDNSGNWGRGGLFDAVARLSATVPNAYERASEFGDLHLGDLHLVQINGRWKLKFDSFSPDNGDPNTHPNAPQWVALAVVQSYNPRRKIPRSGISISDLDVCLAKASFTASRHSVFGYYYRSGA
ncbi:hypothetical protein OROGR_029929 [Orobanche gracilis]